MGNEANYQHDFLVTWEQMHRDAKALSWKLSDLGPWKGIIGITRGGLVPACIVARELDVRLVETLCIASYDHKNQGQANILKQPELEDGGQGWLIVDDLVDTGGTFKIARELYPNAHLAAVYAKPKGVETTDTFITEVSQDTWIHFPWDLSVQYSTPIIEQKKDR